MALRNFIILTVTVACLGYNMVQADDNTTLIQLCDASATQHCVATGYSQCKKNNDVQSCFCSYSNNWTSIADIVKSDLTCKVSSSKFLDPHYWFQDLLAANIVILVLVSIFLFVYVIPIYAKVCALYKTQAPNAALHYFPLLPHDDRGYSAFGTSNQKRRINA